MEFFQGSYFPKSHGFSLPLTTYNVNDKKALKTHLQNIYYNDLKKLGFTDETIRFLSSEEIENIVANDYKFESSSKTHTLVIHFKDLNNGEEIGVPITEDELKEYKTDKNKIINKKLFHLSKERPELKKYTTNNVSGLIQLTSTSPPTSNNIDTAVITLYADCYDSSTDGYIYKTFGANWEWDKVPGWTLTDAVAVSYTGYWWTNITARGGYYENYDNFYYITPDPCNNGASITYDIKSPSKWYTPQSGRIYIRAGNYDYAVPSSLYTVWAGYCHTYITCTGISASISSSGDIGFGINIGTFKTEVAPKPILNNQTTY